MDAALLCDNGFFAAVIQWWNPPPVKATRVTLRVACVR
jgi:hypothetical protein